MNEWEGNRTLKSKVFTLRELQIRQSRLVLTQVNVVVRITSDTLSR
jgi:hypothetical protein